MKQALFIILVILILIRPALLIYEKRDTFFSKGYESQYEGLKNAYYSSQYVQKENPGIIPDETFEAFVAGAFIKGENPIHIVHEHPPLGRYINGISILLFDNASTITIALLIFSLMGIFLIGKTILSSIFALIPVGLFANEPLFLGQLRFTPHLEPVQLPFIIFAIFFFIKGVESKKYLRWFVLTALMLGVVVSVRFFILGGALAFSMILYFVVKKEFGKRFMIFVASLPISLMVLLLSYTRTIQEGYNIIQIFGVQKYIFFYHQSKFLDPASFWDLLLFNRWHTWWADRAIISDPQWIILWPVAAGLTLLFLLSAITKKIKITSWEKVILLWIVMYCMLLSVGTSTTRYFLPLLPFLYILSIDFVRKLAKTHI